MRDFYFKRTFALILLLMLSGFILTFKSGAQKKENSQPEINIDVKKEYDEKGNIILYDSTYSWSSSGDAVDMDIDSLLKRFHQHLEIYNFYDDDGSPHSFMFPGFPGLSPDTTIKNDFFDDFFNWDFPPFDDRSIQEFFDDFLYGFHNFPGFPDRHFRPISPSDSTGLWYDPFEEPFHH